MELKIPSDWGGKVSVDWRGQTVVTKLLLGTHATAEVNSLHHTARGEDAEHGVEVWIFWENSLIEGVRKGLATAHINRESLKKRCEKRILKRDGVKYFQNIFLLYIYIW